VRCRTTLQAGGPYLYNGPLVSYKYAFCADLISNQCPGNLLSSSIQLEANDAGCQQSLGVKPTLSFSELATPSQGMQLTYSGGSPCGQFGSFSTVFTLTCDTSPNPPPVSGSMSGCTMTYSVNTPAACPTRTAITTNPLGAAWLVLIFAVVAMVLYLGGGIAYKRWRHGATGYEAVPNIDTWRRVASCCPCGGRTRDYVYHHSQLPDSDAPDHLYAEAPAGTGSLN